MRRTIVVYNRWPKAPDPPSEYRYVGVPSRPRRQDPAAVARRERLVAALVRVGRSVSVEAFCAKAPDMRPMEARFALASLMLDGLVAFSPRRDAVAATVAAIERFSVVPAVAS